MTEERTDRESEPVAAPPDTAGSPKQGISRRRLMAGMGAVAGMAAAAGLGLPGIGRSPEAESAGVDANIVKRQWVFVFDLRRCDGCSRCVDACNEMHYLHENQSWIKVHKLTDTTGGEWFLPQPCMQCEDPPCVKVCPVQATYKAPDGVTLVDQTWCIGCRMCLAACPYEARTFGWEDPLPAAEALEGPSPEYPVPQVRGTAAKCVMCVHLTRKGEMPGCLAACKMGAIFLGDLTQDVMTNGKETHRLSDYLRENDAFRLREELNTRPRVYYVAGHGQNWVS